MTDDSSGSGGAIVLALETSCDETAAAVLCGSGGPSSEALFSQVETHADFGGVVPEVASRSHLEILPLMIEQALQKAGIALGEVDIFAATTGPGLAPALLVGASAGRGLAAGTGRPFCPVNHLEAHLLSPFFGEEEIPPHVALIVSGGHTLLFDVEGFRRYELLGRTLDDAAGEAFDKVAKMLGLGYPGGVLIEKLAATGNPALVQFPRAMIDSPTFDFSFSGLKTAVRIFLEKNANTVSVEDVCAGFQEAVIEVLATKLARAAKLKNRRIATLSGGVSSNSALQSKCLKLLDKAGIKLRLASGELRTDNAAMIANTALLQELLGGSISCKGDIHPSFDPDRFP